MDKTFLWNNISKIMKDKDISNGTFILRTDISLSTLFDWQLGKSYPDTFMLPKIAKALDVTINDLFADENYGIDGNEDNTLYVLIAKGNTVLEKHQINEEIINKIEVSFDQNVENIQCEGNIVCKDLKDCKVNANSITCTNVEGNVSCSKIECQTINGPIACGFNVNCDEIRGSVASGHNVYAKKIYGDVEATNVYYENELEK